MIWNATMEEQVLVIFDRHQNTYNGDRPSSLRAITRNFLATDTPSLAAAFTTAVRLRLRQTSAKLPFWVAAILIRRNQLVINV
jgi:hypothetical protein